MGERVVAAREAGREAGIGVGGFAVEGTGGGAIAGLLKLLGALEDGRRGWSVGEKSARSRRPRRAGIAPIVRT